MIKLFAVLRRKPGMTPEDFHAHWRDVHAQVVARTRSGRHARRYEQNHRALETYGMPGLQDWDGVTVQWYDSYEDFQASVMEPDYAEIAADLATFVDTDALTWVLTEEPEMVQMPGQPGEGQ